MADEGGTRSLAKPGMSILQVLNFSALHEQVSILIPPMSLLTLDVNATRPVAV